MLIPATVLIFLAETLSTFLGSMGEPFVGALPLLISWVSLSTLWRIKFDSSSSSGGGAGGEGKRSSSHTKTSSTDVEKTLQTQQSGASINAPHEQFLLHTKSTTNLLNNTKTSSHNKKEQHELQKGREELQNEQEEQNEFSQTNTSSIYIIGDLQVEL